MERPTKGYKAVIRYNEFRWFILEMDIPADATIIESGSGYYRTDKVIPRHFYPTLTKTAIIDTWAHSWFDQSFEYELNELAVSKIDKNPNRECTEGIHFFVTREQAINWGMANFGHLAALYEINMEWLLKFNCEFDEGDDDLKRNHGYIYPPEGYSEPHTRVKGEDVWLIDDTNKESMKLLAMFNYAVRAEFGEDGNDDYGDHNDGDIMASLKANETLKTMGVTEAEIDQFMKHYSIYDYWPRTEYDPHNHEFELKLVPVKHQPTEIDEEFLTRLWK